MRLHMHVLVLAGLCLWPLSTWADTSNGSLVWLFTPLSGASEHHIAGPVAWHARLMVLSWGFMFPLGAFAARYFKVLPGQDWPNQLDNRAWWHAHRTLQYAGVVLMTFGLILVWEIDATQGVAAQWHAWLGWSLCVIGWGQVLSGWLRGSKGGPTDKRLRGDHYDMTRRRVVFERLHKTLGWLAILLALIATALGLALVDAPRWMALVLGIWWAVLGIAFVDLHKRGRCLDTYQAIWGPGEQHPGNHRPLTGWGVRRYSAADWRERFGPH